MYSHNWTYTVKVRSMCVWLDVASFLNHLLNQNRSSFSSISCVTSPLLQAIHTLCTYT